MPTTATEAHSSSMTGKRGPKGAVKNMKSQPVNKFNIFAEEGSKKQSSLTSFFIPPSRKLKRPLHNSSSSNHQSMAIVSQDDSPLSNKSKLSRVSLSSHQERGDSREKSVEGNSVHSQAAKSHKDSKPLPAPAKNPSPRPKKTTQLYLDCGQQDFCARTVCDVCGMLSVNGLEEDRKQHEKICKDYRMGVPWNSPDRVLRTKGNVNIVEVCENVTKYVNTAFFFAHHSLSDSPRRVCEASVQD